MENPIKIRDDFLGYPLFRKPLISSLAKSCKVKIQGASSPSVVALCGVCNECTTGHSTRL